MFGFEDRSPITLSVFFCGTGGRLVPAKTQIGYFFKKTRALDITNHDKLLVSDRLPNQLKMGFDGVRVTNGWKGLIFGVGMKAKCKVVMDRLAEILAKKRPVVLNCIGLSRGGIACLYLCQMTADLGDALTINLCLFDPVPGNLLTTARHVDWFNLSAANDCQDISRSTNIDRVLALYPHEPLPNLLMHAPMFPTYPPGAKVDQDVILGCHQGALFNHYTLPCRISRLRIGQFLISVGTPLSSDLVAECKSGTYVESEILKEMEWRRLHRHPTSRYCHGKVAYCIVRNPTGKFLNRHHERLVKERDPDFDKRPEGYDNRGQPDRYMLEVKRGFPFPWTVLVVCTIIIYYAMFR